MDTEIHTLLANIWFFIIGLILFLYVVLDGFDLGVGILSLFTRNDSHRAIMMTSLESIWDANETWLVLLGGALFGAFPMVYAIALQALYIPVMIMLFALIFRGVAFEFRHHARNKVPWNLAFGVSSLFAGLAQGFAFGGMIGGLDIQEAGDQGSIWGWLTPFSAIVAFGVVTGYTLLGATYLIIKTEGAIQLVSINQSYVAAILEITLLAAALFSASRFSSHFAARWAASESGFYLNLFVLLAVIAFMLVMRALHKKRELSAFFWSAIITLASLVAMTIGYYPYMIPASVLLTQAASSSRTLIFMLASIGLLIPVMLIYSSYQYLVFRGKVHTDKHSD
ncbi:cytochrome d ubiquinol oxidase subunit II [Methylomicrobium sp. Wu6]|uniref:cytochrome d ubiquinol oxidase subunit II n=1 Tax=Methylomicrobium sp. Wu6 TaxID=3107928 RepID=UPI002DD66AE0|nr:cytochrome d ubiquinol oxidase subunit II [Methylomicrobium sp. Wu6]MEC4748941.1 cytochrome d ubiquinol oxidase subunit II [Methylomicrobium sp. Wu6]